jgi:hypothetical protein
MANGHGGKRTPHSPAPASGPGRLSKRTDGGPSQKLMAQTGGDYGSREDSLQQQRSAPMSQQDSITPTPVSSGDGGGAGAYSGVPFGAGSQRPGEPITHGVDIGPGGGSDVLGLQQPGAMPTGYLTNMLQQMSATDTTGTLAKLYVIAQQRGV